jgi:hypothetical protein
MEELIKNGLFSAGSFDFNFFWRIPFIYTRIDFYEFFENRKVNRDIPGVMTSGHPPIA